MSTLAAAGEVFMLKHSLLAFIAKLVGHAEIRLMEVHWAQISLSVFLALLSLQIEDNKGGLDFRISGLRRCHEALVVIHFRLFTTQLALEITTAMFLNVFSLKLGTTFPISNKFSTPFQSLTETGEITLVIRFLLPVVVIAGLTSEVSVAVATVDPLVETAGRGLSAIGAIVTALMIFNI
ncbi:MAG: hypothetical protein GY696_30055, partial [Gammaproteobacteria bacterium]|nr:hypothetical protein [Gammaproteobacteria bacterium]